MVVCPIDKTHGHMKETHTQEGDAKMIRWICQWPGCKGNGTDLDTREDLIFKDESDTKKYP
jgi:hypothetical protein